MLLYKLYILVLLTIETLIYMNGYAFIETGYNT